MKITLPNGTILEMDDTPSGVNKQVEVPQADDVVEESTSSGDPVATEKRSGQISAEPKPAAKPAAAETAPAPLPGPKSAGPASERNLLDHENPYDIYDPQKSNPNVYHWAAPREE
jgi:hypothetical protein